MIVDSTSKVFENPETGRFNATIIDVQDLGKKINFKGEEKVRLAIFWVLDKLDSEGKPFRVRREVNAVVTDKPKKSSLYEIAEGVLGTAPPVPFDTEILIGRSNELVVMRETDPKTGKVYANVKVIMPLPAGAIAPRAPEGFVRAQNRPKAQPYVQAAAPAVAVNTAANTVASTPTAQPTVQGQANPAPAPQAPAVVVDAAF